jgi:hypothetical protein
MLERFVPLSLRADQERRLAVCEEARTAVDLSLRDSLTRGGFDLWGRRDSPMAEPERVPVSAIGALRFDYERQTACGEGLKLFDVCLRRPATETNSASWARATARRLQAEGRIYEGMKQAEVARVLEAEAKKAVKAGQITRALKATYLENQLGLWGIWPLRSLK